MIQTGIEMHDGFSSVMYNVVTATESAVSSVYDLQQAVGIDMPTEAYDDVAENAIRIGEEIQYNTQKQEEFNQIARSGSDCYNGLISNVLRLASAYIGVQTAKNALKESDELTQTTARLNMMNDGLQSTKDLVNMVYISAQDARGSFSDMADVVARFGNNAKDAFSSNAEVIQFANLIQKQMTIAGASTQEAANAELQLSQALGSGVLRGDELNSIFEQAPNLIQNIADYLDVPIGKIREMAQDGELSASVVKAAIFDASDDINRQFEEMPMTWGQAWQSMQNTAIMAFQPVLQRLNDMVNSSDFQLFTTSAIDSLAIIANITLNIFDMVGSVAGFVQNNWSILEPLVLGVAAAMGIYLGYLAVTNAMELMSNAIKVASCIASYAHAAATGAEVSATAAATAAQYGFNTALLACPITWILILIIAVIAVIYMVVAAINKVTNSTISATGVICGVITTAGAFIWNTAIGLINAIIQSIYNTFVQPFISIIEWVLNVCNGGFDSFGGAVANLIGQIISWFLSLGKVVTKIIDAIFGTDWTSGLNSLQDTVLAWGKNDNAITLDRNAPQIDAHINYDDAWNTGYSFGEKVDETVQNFNVGNLFGRTDIPRASDYANALNSMPNLADTADSTSKTAKSLEATSEDLKYLRDIAERDIINRFTTAEIKVEMTNHNNINSGVDADGLVEHLKNRLEEEMSNMAEGEHNSV
ncbi:tape measure protein [[Clostridium] polysaccharolyticum]|uniref:Tape measure domain-containing protein n=1 Tax=[Clostridium] polysaccharolyticum TaxID=29364 RepID=A0A1H9YHN6_9FIRM|nr:tape measure protein [[Clostridium] polysaccharolyticum]SES68488.1 tape measure domain-containing protein [[Clostridium] polysaccharolyticum]